MNTQLPNYIFEVSWEVCNKVGGIHTVVTTKAPSLINQLADNYIAIGPDIVRPEAVNPEFVEDASLYKSWRENALNEGLRIRVGRWKSPGHPVAILIDFSNWINEKDKVFAKLWEDYRLDSLSGQWDYLEPALFGYATGKVIDSFVRFNLSTSDTALAQFHEWMTGTGVLYLKENMPQVATAFTTHATVLGRAIAGNNRPLYKNLTQFNPDEVARECNVVSKQSLEKIAAEHADVFTTVSEITSRECKVFLGKKVDFITPNGFEDTFVPEPAEFTSKRKKARHRLIKVAETLFDKKIPEDCLLVATSGRFEFRNKGIDLFIKSLGKVNENENVKKTLIAFILIPASHYGFRKELARKLNGEDVHLEGSKTLTHYLHNPENDPILNLKNSCAIQNASDKNVKIVYVPCYLNGDDGIFNLSYYDLLIGFDLTIFPSYYEPWGYTPMESLAFSIPTITTTLAGFGMWVNQAFTQNEKGITVINRNDDNDDEVIDKIASQILEKLLYSEEEMKLARENAFLISKTALWKNLVSHYKEAYSFALNRVSERKDKFVMLEDRQSEKIFEYILPFSNQPTWQRVIVKSSFPENLKPLNEIMQNYWWSWDDEAQELFEEINPESWKDADYNPVVLFENVPYERLNELSTDKKYIAKLSRVHKRFIDYVSEKPSTKQPKIAYFSMEYGIHNSLKIYSGGLGLLAGDYLKEASDQKVNITAVGLLYRYGYFSQMLSLNGEQQATYDFQNFSKLPIQLLRDKKGDPLILSIFFPGRTLFSRIWKVNVGRVSLYLLDTDLDTNLTEDRSISHHLYGGDRENRLKQEILLGVGGIRALEMLDIEPDLYHSNEGHSAFIGLERMREFVEYEKLTIFEAQEIVKATTLFTTHTPVPAGHDSFEEDLIRRYLGQYPERLKLNWEKFMALGRSNPNDHNEKFNMSFLAAHLAQDVNGVSKLHGLVTREMLNHLWPGYLPEELHINYVTNGVHLPTWKAKEWNNVFDEVFDNNLIKNQGSKEHWAKIMNVPDKTIWDIKQNLRNKLIQVIKERFKENWIKRHEDPKNIFAIENTLSENTLTICFARRFATYKRAHLLFKNPERLAKIINNPEKPVQFIFAGKAHPHDKAGQDLIKMIIDMSKQPQFLGKILFLQNYDIRLAKTMVQGADIWCNTPIRKLEASGTSGEKAVMNGTLHFSILDGWWDEGYKEGAGWAIGNDQTYENQELQDFLDAEVLYSILEQDIIPTFYKRNKSNIPVEWVKHIKNSMVHVASEFTTTRMLNDYISRFYTQQFKRSKELFSNDFAQIKKIAAWKRKISKNWENIRVEEVQVFDKKWESLLSGLKYKCSIVLDLHGLSPKDIGVEIVFTENYAKLIATYPLDLIKFDGGRAYYSAEISMNQPGTFDYGIRIFPFNDLLKYKQDFPLIRWI